jgi:hypothetical protein
MARIRSIKPEFWTSEKVMECSFQTRLFFIGLWNFCYDYGRHPTSTKQLKALIFPGDDIAPEAVRGMVDELASNGLIELYTVDGKEYLFVAGWAHQKIEKRQDAKFPRPSANCRVSFGERSSNGIAGEDRKGEDRDKEKNQNSESSSSMSAGAKNDDDDDLLQGLRKAANGKIAPSCVNVAPIRRLIDQGFDREKDVLAVFREAVTKLHEPLKTFNARWIAEEIAAWSKARISTSKIDGSNRASRKKLTFVTPDESRWAAAKARYRQEHRRKFGPPVSATGPLGHGAKGWYFPAHWPECAPIAAPLEAAE